MGKDGKVWNSLERISANSPARSPIFLHKQKSRSLSAEEMRKYLASYCKAFGLEKYLSSTRRS